jgi:putative ABC transport system permease protein
MTSHDIWKHSWRAIAGRPQRSFLTMLGIVIGVSAVILLTSLGEGTRSYILTQFTQFGTNLISVNPGRMETSGVPGALGGTLHPLTLDDCEAIGRLRGVSKTMPVAMGTAAVEFGRRSRNVFVYGVTGTFAQVWRMNVRLGRTLPDDDPRRAPPLAVLGPTLKREIFGPRSALGEHIRVGGERFFVVGIMEPKGQFLGFDIDDAVYIPISQAMRLFNKYELDEVDVLASQASSIDSLAARMRRLLIDRHDGEEDFTITTQTGMLETLDRILRIVSLAVGAIGAISLLVGAIGILTMMWISVSERTDEIGLAKAVGATPGQILALFLAEAAVLSTGGGLIGLVVGLGVAGLIHAFLPGLPVRIPFEFVILAVAVSLFVGLLSGILPARRAARLDPVQALAAE